MVLLERCFVEAAHSTLNNLYNHPIIWHALRTLQSAVLLQDYHTFNNPLTFVDEELEVVAKFSYLGRCISNDWRKSSEISSLIAKARTVLMNLRHLWQQKGISHIEGRRILRVRLGPCDLIISNTFKSLIIA
ncbi:unnamed protein product, partial [Dicrocoelium dendriticum]